MKKILSSLLLGAALIPSLSYADNFCEKKVYVRGVTVNVSSDTNAWKIYYSDQLNSPNVKYIVSDGNSVNLEQSSGRAIFSMAMNAMNMKQAVWIIGQNAPSCRGFTGLLMSDTPNLLSN